MVTLEERSSEARDLMLMHIYTARGWRPLQSPRNYNHQNGSSVHRAIPMPRQKTWAEDEGLTLPSIAEQYGRAIFEYRMGYINHKAMLARKDSRNVVGETPRKHDPYEFYEEE